MNGPESVEVPTPLGASLEDRPLDGRAARSAKTRNAIADAMLDLLTEGVLRPTAREIADRAGVSVRSVYVHFDDLEDLFCVAAQRNFARIAPLLAPVPVTGSTQERAHALMRQRLRLYAQFGAVARATRLHAESSPTLARILRDARRRSRADLERVFAGELRDLSEQQRANAVAVLDVLAGPDAWQTLRELHELSSDAALRCVVDSMVRQLEVAAR